LIQIKERLQELRAEIRDVERMQKTMIKSLKTNPWILSPN
jgi:hypothetical protein